MCASVDPFIFQQLQKNSVVPLHWASFPFNLNLQALPLCDEQKRPYLGSKFCQEPGEACSCLNLPRGLLNLCVFTRYSHGGKEHFP